jgi:PKD repeat protein
MATPVIDVSFTADVQCGASPLTVSFTNTTDITDGFGRVFLWDFGDGSISTDESPSHVYDGDPGESFSVRLTVLATEGEFTGLSSSTKNPTRVSNVYLVGSDADIEVAWDNRVPSALDTAAVQHYLSFNGVTFSYFTNNPVLTFISPSEFEAFTVLQAKVNVGIDFIEGNIVVNGISGAPAIVNNWETHSRLIGITVFVSITDSPQALPQAELATVPAGQQRGMNATLRTLTYLNSATQVFGEHEEVDFISLATLPVADFTATPTVGPNPLNVKFTNTSEESDCGPASTYSWKKRIYGSGASFVEFSTQKNPSHTFTK